MVAPAHPAPVRASRAAPAARSRFAAAGVLVACAVGLVGVIVRIPSEALPCASHNYFRLSRVQHKYDPGTTHIPKGGGSRRKYPFHGLVHTQFIDDPDFMLPLPKPSPEYIEKVPAPKVEKEPVRDAIIEKWENNFEAARIALLPAQPDRGYVTGADAMYYPPPDPELPKLHGEENNFPEEKRALFEHCDSTYDKCYAVCNRIKIVKVQWPVDLCKWNCFTQRRNCFYFAMNPARREIDQEKPDTLQPMYDWQDLRSDAIAKKPLRRSLARSQWG